MSNWFQRLIGRLSGKPAAKRPARSATASVRAGSVKTGKVVHFNWSRGYGFVECPDLEGRIFLHRTKLKKTRIKVGDEIRFELDHNEKGYFVARIISD